MSASISRNHPLAIAQFLDGIVQSYLPPPEQFAMAAYFPTKLSPTNKIEWDIVMPLYGGLVKPTSRGAESPIIKGGGIKRAYVETTHFREKYRFDPEETVAIRQLGTLDQTRDPRELLAEKTLWLRRRTQTRIEWFSWKAVFGQVNINENGVSRLYDFPIPDYLDVTLTGADQWDAPTTANPLNDIMEAMDVTSRFSYRWQVAWMNNETAKKAVQIEQFRDFYKDTLSNYSMNQLPATPGINISILNNILTRFMTQTPQIKVFDGRFELVIPTTDLAVVGANNLVLDEINHVEVGDEIVIESMDSVNTQLSTIVAANPQNLQIALADPIDFAYKPGSVVHLSKPYIPDGKVVLMPAIGQGDGSVPELGTTYFSPTVFNPGSLLAPKAGIFSELQMHDDEDPKFADLIEGAEFVSVIKRPEARYIYTVF